MAGNQQPIIIKKIKKGGHGHHGGAWKVAFADFVTAMMAFFMVMWIIGLSQDQRSMIQAYFNDPIGFSKNPPKNGINILPPGGVQKQNIESSGEQTRKAIDDIHQLESLEKSIEEAIKADPALSQLVEKGSLIVELTPSGLKIEFVQAEKSGDAFFEIGSSTVRPSAIPLIAKLGKSVAASNRMVKIQGHTDARPYPSANYDNFNLSSDRANAVRRILVANGVRDKQISSVDGYADRLLRVPSDPYSHLNRRVSILLPYAESEEKSALPADHLGSDKDHKFDVVEDIRPDVNIKPH